MIENIEEVIYAEQLAKYPVIETDTMIPFGYEETNLAIPEGFIEFLTEKSKELEDLHINNGIFCPVDEYGNKKEFCPCVYARSYNMFHFYHTFIFDIQNTIRKMTIAYCEKNNIDFEEQRYLIHGFYSMASIMKELDWHDHGTESNHLHGFLIIDAEPSETYYYVDGQVIKLKTKNGRMIVGKNTMHARGSWNQSKPRIVIAFNIKPAQGSPSDQFYILL